MMKHFWIGSTATLFAAAAFAQTGTGGSNQPVANGGSNNSSLSSGMSESSSTMSGDKMSGDRMAGGKMTNDQMMARDGVTMSNGHMMRNGKKMTSAEVSAYKAKMKSDPMNKPM